MIVFFFTTGFQCKNKMDKLHKNPCKNFHCQNGGICQAVKSTKKQQYHPKCICPKNRSGLNCQRPNLCLNHCLNRGRCVLTSDGSVSCICPHGLAGSRCERKDTRHWHPKDDQKEAKSAITSVLSGIGIICTLALLFGVLWYFCKKKRLVSAFKHRRMAENLLSNNIEFSNQMYLPDEREDDSDIIIMREPNHRNVSNNLENSHFSNPVYDSMFGRSGNSDQEGNVKESEELLVDVRDEESQNHENLDPESVDLLTERHRGNIEL